MLKRPPLSARHRRFAGAALLAIFAHLALPAPARAAEAAKTGPVQILALGDSLTSGYGLPPRDGFVPQLQRALQAAGIDAQVSNAGVAGDTSADGLARLDWALAEDPAVVIVEFGANDALRGLDPALVRTNLDAILTRLGQQRRAVLLVGMLAPPNLGPDYGRAFDAIYPDLAKKHGVALYPFFLDGVATNPALNQADGIHPTAAGVAIIVHRILPALRRTIDATARKP
jgi:acyl-CoA thioesterase-1